MLPADGSGYQFGGDTVSVSVEHCPVPDSKEPGQA